MAKTLPTRVNRSISQYVKTQQVQQNQTTGITITENMPKGAIKRKRQKDHIRSKKT